MHLIIAGRGSLAKAIVNICKELPVSHAFFDTNSERVALSVAVHCSGTGTVLPKLLKYCEERAIPLIQASTGQNLPDVVRTVVVEAPNLALPIIEIMRSVADIQVRFESVGTPKRSVKESHQASKTSVPGTALRFAEAVKLGRSEITSVRDPSLQRGLGIPEEHLGRHGYHWITWQFEDLEVEISTRVNGLRPYALGAIKVARSLLERQPMLESGVYPVNEVVV